MIDGIIRTDDAHIYKTVHFSNKLRVFAPFEIGHMLPKFHSSSVFGMGAIKKLSGIFKVVLDFFYLESLFYSCMSVFVCGAINFITLSLFFFFFFSFFENLSRSFGIAVGINH